MSGIVVKSYFRMLCKIEEEMCQNIRQEKRLKQSNSNIEYKDRAKISRSKSIDLRKVPATSQGQKCQGNYSNIQNLTLTLIYLELFVKTVLAGNSNSSGTRIVTAVTTSKY